MLPATNTGVSATPLCPPLRDNISINPEDFASSVVGQTKREQRMRMSATTNAFKASSMNLPKPKNNFELVMPDDEEPDASGANGTTLPEDAADWDVALQRHPRGGGKKGLVHRSQSAQLGLPRPANIDLAGMPDGLNLLKDEEELSEADKLIYAKLVQLIQHDFLTYPLPGTTKAGSTVSTYEMRDDASMDAAKVSINTELAALIGLPSASASQLCDGLLALAKTDPVSTDLSWASEHAKLMYSATRWAWVNPTMTDVVERIEGYAALLPDMRNMMSKEAVKLEKLGKILGEYHTSTTTDRTLQFSAMQTWYSTRSQS